MTPTACPGYHPAGPLGALARQCAHCARLVIPDDPDPRVAVPPLALGDCTLFAAPLEGARCVMRRGDTHAAQHTVERVLYSHSDGVVLCKLNPPPKTPSGLSQGWRLLSEIRVIPSDVVMLPSKRGNSNE